MPMRFLRLCVLLISCAIGQVSVAQSSDTIVRSSILVIDPDRLFEETLLWDSIQAEFEKSRQAFFDENVKLIEALEIEEAQLAEQRNSLPADQFKVLADEFDTRAQDIRAARDAKQIALQQELAGLRVEFLNSIIPIMRTIMLERGAGGIMRKDQLFLNFDAIDVTDEAIKQINARFEAQNPAPNEETQSE